MYAVNLHSRIASRVLWRVARFPYTTEDDIYNGAKPVRWREHFSAERTFKVETNAHRSPVKSLDFWGGINVSLGLPIVLEIATFLMYTPFAAAGFAVFTAASLACAWAPSLPLFLAFRLVQGLGAAFLFPILMALVGEAVAPERLGRAFGLFGVTQTLGLGLGPLLAGFLETHVGWQWFFVTLAALAALAAAGFLRLVRGERRPAPATAPGTSCSADRGPPGRGSPWLPWTVTKQRDSPHPSVRRSR